MSLTVTVNVSSSIQEILDQNVTEGNNLTLTCNVSGIPTPVVSWIKPDGQRFNESVLELLKVSRNQSGTYRCEASNDCGNAVKTASVEVQYKPENVQLMSSATNYKACRGDVISFNCSADANPAVVSYQLFENETAILNTSATGMWSKTLENEGVFIYKCVAHNKLGSMYSTNVMLTVNVPSSIIQITQHQNATEGGNVTLMCNVSGVPPRTLYWMKPNGDRFEGLKLEVKNVNRSEVGEYKCEASNECGNSTKMTRIDVQLKPENVLVMSSAMNNTACKGKVISFNCSADAHPAVTSYQLFENEIAILNASVTGMWSKSFEKEGEFAYKCVANNSVGSEYSMSVTITVNVPSSIIQITQHQNVTEGDNVTLMCNVAGVSPPMVSWITPNGQRVSRNPLKVENGSRSEAGEYKCEASNECGNATKMTSVAVQYKPENVQLTSSAMDYKACKGAMISFNCSADANPAVTSYQLFENETAILNTSAPGMWSKTLENDGVFTYKCVAKNSLGSGVSSDVMVTVNVPSTIETMRDQTVTEGETVNLTCTASGMRQPKVSWIKPNGESVAENVLELVNITRNEVGEYTCEASNECGNATVMANIDVHYKPENVQLTTSVVNSTACQGDTITFNCSADAKPAVTSYQLYKNDTVMYASLSEMWKETLRSGGVFVYKCRANNTVVSAYSKDATFTVNVPSSIQPMQNKTVTEGDNVTLMCNVSGLPSPTVSWLRPNDQRRSEYMLELVNISRNEAGEYKCEASNECGNATEMATIDVQFPSSIIQITQHQNVTEGDNVTLMCNVSGVPPPTVYWMKPNGESVSGYNLEVKNISRSEAGKYKCEASNEFGNATKMTSVGVQYTPENVQFTSSAMDNKACKDDIISFNCSADANPLVTSYQLLENGTADLDVNRLGMWKKNVSTGGVFMYKCVANNSLGSGVSSYVMVTVNVPSTIETIQDQNITEGETINLTCAASGMPQPNVFWIKPNNQSVAGNVLKLVNISRNEASQYKCEASNECGNAAAMASIDVHYTPENVQFTTSAMDNKACTGDMISFNCSADANPAVTSYQLFENDTAILDVTRLGVWKRHVSMGEVFMYKCVANNSLGSGVSSDVMVTVNVPSTIETIQDQNVTEGETVDLTCAASGMPQPNVSWIKPNNQSVAGNVLKLENISRNEAGQYKCEASNECGNATAMASIDVHCK
ncbi:hemicentin-2-like isoform X2 [Stylophora pistillata]|uniref:hemicentin-2-like isoform X2 n=1 Tax=Stylophora pistillata TaxID=50429 RepID=UPI000C055CD5|nr:hemicentin-2-like isoform X2 [Stylophora pistillata]